MSVSARDYLESCPERNFEWHIWFRDSQGFPLGQLGELYGIVPADWAIGGCSVLRGSVLLFFDRAFEHPVLASLVQRTGAAGRQLIVENIAVLHRKTDTSLAAISACK